MKNTAYNKVKDYLKRNGHYTDNIESSNFEFWEKKINLELNGTIYKTIVFVVDYDRLNPDKAVQEYILIHNLKACQDFMKNLTDTDREYIIKQLNIDDGSNI